MRGKAMYKKILVPIDEAHSASSENSLNLAQHLCGNDGDITVLTVIEDVPGYVAMHLPKEFVRKARADAEASLEKQLAKTKCKAAIVVKNGHAANTITEMANENGFDLIVIASHKPEAMDRLLGSTASRVVRKAKCSVLVTR